MATETAFIHWYNSQTGETQLWVMDEHRLVRRATVLGEDGAPAFVGPPFRIVGIGDFTADRRPDILWHHSQTGEVQLWVMHEQRLVRRATVLDVDGVHLPSGGSLSIAGVGDFSGDGRADILWHYEKLTETELWVMDENRLVRREPILGEDGSQAFVGPPFSIVGVADFTGDGRADILWHHWQTHETQLWVMNENRLIRRATVLGEDGNPVFIGPPFSIVAVADFTGDGKADILWHHSETGETQLWVMDEHRLVRRATVLGEDGNPAFIGPPFSIVGAAPKFASASGPFCGYPEDGDAGVGGPTAFGPLSARWSRGSLKVAIDTTGADFTPPAPPQPQTAAAVIEAAFREWETAERFFEFSFVKPGSPADFHVHFGGRELNAGFGSPGGVRASGIKPESGEVKFDASESWDHDGLLRDSLHEIGHALGLTHSGVDGTLMYPIEGDNTSLDQDAVEAIRAIYGWLPQQHLADRATTHRATVGSVGRRRGGGIDTVPQMVWKGAKEDPGIYWAEFVDGQWTPQSRVPGVGCSYSPALTEVPLPTAPGDETGLLMAWKGVGDDQGLYWTRKLSDGWEEQRPIPNVGSSRAPTLANLNGQVYMAWKGIDGDSDLWGAQFDETTETWMPQERIAAGMTSESPSLVAYGESLYMFWKGVRGDFGGYYSHLDTGEVHPLWRPAKPITYGTFNAKGGESNAIGTTGAIAATTRGDSIMIAWKGAEGDASIYFSLFRDDTFSGQVTIPGAGTSVGPSVARVGNATLMAWKGVEGDRTIYWSWL
ncbi:MAG TPA: matrixin family metalloprotease [Solirubrobacterales bacterium]|nr:matrixin family metalloprotease [Solirubrobacterales bacterium]